MMRAIISASLRFRYLVAALGVSLVYFGALRVNDLPVDVFPEFAPPRVEIQTICLGLSPAEVEALVTVPMENALAGVPGVDVMRSKSVDQLSALAELVERGQTAVPTLLSALERPDVELRHQVVAALQAILDRPIAFDPYAPQVQRKKQLATLREQLERRAG